MGRSKRFFINSINGMLLQLFTVASGFIIPRIILVNYGSEIYGLTTSITQFISYFNLVEAGLASAAVYALYKPLADENQSKISSIISATKRLYVISGYIFSALVLGLAFIYPTFVKVATLSVFETSALVLVIGFAGAMEFFTMAKYRAILTADQKEYVISFATIVAIVINTIVIALLATEQVNIVILRTMALSSIFARSIILSTYVKLTYKYISYKEDPDYSALNKRWAALYLKILGALQIGAPVIMATFFTNLETVSIYSVYSLVAFGLTRLLSFFSGALTAVFGNVLVLNQQAILQKAYQEFEFAYYALISWVFSCAAILIMPFIRLYTSGVTDVDYYVPLIGFLFVINELLYNLKTPQGILVISAGHFKETKLQTTIQGLIIIVGGVILINIWCLVGLLLAVILSNIYRVIDLSFYVPHKITKLKVGSTIRGIVRALICFSLIYWPSLYFTFHSINNYLDWFLMALITALYSCIIVLTVNYIFDRRTFISVISRFRNLSKKESVS
jgi:hypothetical protein